MILFSEDPKLLEEGVKWEIFEWYSTALWDVVLIQLLLSNVALNYELRPIATFLSLPSVLWYSLIIYSARALENFRNCTIHRELLITQEN
jgi:hypothetical protein